MASAYTASLVLMCGWALAFPGAVMTHPPLAVTRSVAPYLYVSWHCGFPVLLGIAFAPWPARLTRPVPFVRRRLVATAVIAGSALVAGGPDRGRAACRWGTCRC